MAENHRLMSSDRRNPNAPEPSHSGGSEIGGRLILARRPGDRFGTLRRLVVSVDKRTVAKLRRGEEFALEAKAGEHRIQVRMDWAASLPVWVHVANDHTTRVSFGVEHPLTQLKQGLVGWRAFKSRTRGGWGVSVEPAEDRIDPPGKLVDQSVCKHPRSEREILKREYPTLYGMGAPSRVTYRCKACGRVWTLTGGPD
jgi:hypothetical protein